MPTTEEGRVRICMTSNPTSGDPNIRMGFFDLDTGMMYDSDNKTELGKSNISRKEFNVLIKKPANITQRMLDVAITAPENPLNFICNIFN